MINDKLRGYNEDKLSENKSDAHNIGVRDYRSLRKHQIGLDLQNSNIENIQELDMDHKLKREMGGVEHYTAAAAAAAAAAGMIHHHIHTGIEHMRGNANVEMEVCKKNLQFVTSFQNIKIFQIIPDETIQRWAHFLLRTWFIPGTLRCLW